MRVGMSRTSTYQASGGRGKTGRGRRVVIAGVVLLAFALSPVPASALNQRGHQFADSFGQEGSKPTAIAVSESTGDVYVLESAADRVARYGPAPAHVFLEAWGYGVSNGEAKFERCTQECKPGLAGHGREGQFDSPVAIAVDNSAGPSAGDVYVVANRTWKYAAVYKFTPEGVLLGNLITKAEKQEELEEVIEGVAVDRGGTVWVEREDGEEEVDLQRFSGLVGEGRESEQAYELVSEGPLGEWFSYSELSLEDIARVELFSLGEPEISTFGRPVRPGFAVDAKGDVYLTYEPFGYDYEEIRANHAEALAEPCVSNRCFAEELNPSRPQGTQLEVAKFDRENTTGLGVDVASGEAEDDVYVDHGSNVAAFNSAGTPIQRFGAQQLGDDGGSGLAVDSSTDEVLVADTVAGKIDVFTPEGAAAPKVVANSLAFAHAKASSVELRAVTDRTGGSDVNDYFEYGAAPCAGGGCTKVAPAAALEEGFGEQTLAVTLSGLSPSTVYRFRVVAESSLGRAESEELTFTTQPSTVQASMLDGRAWELVSSEKNGANVNALEHEGGLVEAAENGRSVAYLTTAPIGEKKAGGYTGGPAQAEIYSERGAGQTGWSAEDVAGEAGAPTEGLILGGPWEYEFFSPAELETGIVVPQATVPPAPGVEYSWIYLRNMKACAHQAASACFMPLVNQDDATAGMPRAPEVKLQGATSDVKHVLFSAAEPLVKAAPGSEATPDDGLYEWFEEASPDDQLQLISVLPSAGDSPTGGDVGAYEGEKEARANAVSQNGARVVWGVEKHLYMHEFSVENGVVDLAGSARTLLVDEPNSNAPRGTSGELLGAQEPIFQTAMGEDSKVFFTDPQVLTCTTSHSVTSKCEVTDTAPAAAHYTNLYVFEPEKPAGQRVTLLTADVVRGESAGVVGGILGSGEGEGGANVYFVANGVLTTHGNGRETPTTGECYGEGLSTLAGCNLYVAHEGGSGWEAPRFIARLSSEDGPDWGRGPEQGEASEYVASRVTARVSPDGEYLAFMSDRSLTGYDNRDANSGHPDEEVYLYRYSDGELVCASCNPSGERPVGVYDEEEGTGEGIDLLVDRLGDWTFEAEADPAAGGDPWLAGSVPGWTPFGAAKYSPLYQSRYLSNSGRLFFDSADALVPLAKPTRTETIEGHTAEVGVENVYEYEPAGVGGCASSLQNTDGGCVQLISSGESEQESAFLDASETGDDVFFVTAAKLSPLDAEASFNIYDARVCAGGAGEPCPTLPPESSQQCHSESECRAVYTATTVDAPATATTGTGNVVSRLAVLPTKVVHKHAKPTRAELLAKALRQCRKDRRRSERSACERLARKRYGSPGGARRAEVRRAAAAKRGAGR
jgi:hypothetical protein